MREDGPPSPERLRPARGPFAMSDSALGRQQREGGAEHGNAADGTITVSAAQLKMPAADYHVIPAQHETDARSRLPVTNVPS